MIGVEEAKEKAAAYFDRHYRRWASELFSDSIQEDRTTSLPQSTNLDPCFSLALHPPTEKQVLMKNSGAKTWVQSWHAPKHRGHVVWAVRKWASVGAQEVPERLVLSGAESIAEFGGRAKVWAQISKRTQLLTTRWKNRWSEQCGEQSLSAAIKTTAAKYGALTDRDWSMLLSVIDWLVENPEVERYVRQLPIRGIDTKWIEKHRGLVNTLYGAIANKKSLEFQKAPHQMRVRFLDTTLAPEGIDDISLSPEALNGYSKRPRTVLVCENLVSVMALPEMPHTIAIFGEGYGVGSLAKVTWLDEVSFLYWGDLDTNGFAILNQLRHYHPHARSIMMDTTTLLKYRDLSVIEASPNLGTFELLSATEQEAFQSLNTKEGFLRLEQERIEWSYALEKIKEAVQG